MIPKKILMLILSLISITSSLDFFIYRALEHQEDIIRERILRLEDVVFIPHTRCIAFK